ncbi:MAG: HNH endonuclease [Synergistaceae bacterium]|nr:HNH endonuclease [Synergistaceae bacterium]
MNILERSLVEKTGHDNGWEVVLRGEPLEVRLASARHEAVAEITALERSSPEKEMFFTVRFISGPEALVRELTRESGAEERHFEASGYDGLGALLRRAAQLAMSLPRNAEEIFARKSAEAIKELKNSATEVERVVRQRVGQDVFRDALMCYWEGACAVTGITQPEILRASHAKPWADCESDAERLDVYNGLLLTANLDALFDRGLISFGNDGIMLIGGVLSGEILRQLGLDNKLRMRWTAPDHHKYLDWHRNKVFR